MKNNRGISLVLVMALFVALGVIAVAFITMTSTEVKISKYTVDSKIAFHAAEAGIELGIARIPTNLSAFPASPDTWLILPNQARYKSGPPDSLPATIPLKGTRYLVGYSIEQGSDFYSLLYDVETSGRMSRSVKELKARVSCGPMPGGTQY